MAHGIGRDHPGQLRPAYCSRPPAPCASAKPRATVQRLPATCPTGAKAAACGATTTSAGSSVGALRRRRTKSPRRQGGCHGVARGSPRQAYQRGPWVPSPALNRPPPLSPQRRQAGFDLRVLASTPALFFPRDGQARGGRGFLPPPPPWPLLSIDALPRHPGGRDARGAGALQPRLRPLGCGRHGPRRRHPGAFAAARVVGPCLRHREVPLKHDVTLGTRLGQAPPHWTMRNATRCPALVARHPSRLLAFFAHPRRSDDQHGLRGSQRLDHGGAHSGAEGLSLP